MSRTETMTINVNGNLMNEYACGVHDKDHTIILNGKPIRTYTCGHEDEDNRIILNGVPYRSYRRSEEDADAVFLNGKPYYGGEMGEVKQTRWMTSKRKGVSSYSSEVLPAHEYSPAQGTINMNGQTIHKSGYRHKAGNPSELLRTARQSRTVNKKSASVLAVVFLGFYAIVMALAFFYSFMGH